VSVRYPASAKPSANGPMIIASPRPSTSSRGEARSMQSPSTRHAHSASRGGAASAITTANTSTKLGATPECPICSPALSPSSSPKSTHTTIAKASHLIAVPPRAPRCAAEPPRHASRPRAGGPR
jgi:hypothetical protein